MAAFLLSSIGEPEKSRVGGDDNHVVFDQQFLAEKGSLRWCVVATACSFVAKVREEIFAHFYAVAV
jgi:hypothetical protein